MLFMICPTCGEHLGNKELIYIAEMKAVCDSIGIDDDLVSQGKFDTHPEYVEKRQKIINKLLRRGCCKMRMMNYIDVVQLVTG
uniref:Uncharacterized protein n=1 Tax=viral metagenome TaxID=1070528 RepID=A0A6C0E9T9_9ZZZZ